MCIGHNSNYMYTIRIDNGGSEIIDVGLYMYILCCGELHL